jgi:hypothetical protein
VCTGIEKTRLSDLAWLKKQIVSRSSGAESASADMVKYAG